MNGQDRPPPTPAEIHAGYAPLPHLVHGGESMQIGAVFDRDAVAPLVPAGAELDDGATGGFNFGHAPEGWGVTPYRAAWIWLDIKGYRSETDDPCRWYVKGVVDGSERAKTYYRHPAGEVRMSRTDREWTASAGTKDGFRIAAQARLTGLPISRPTTRNFLTRDEYGNLYVSPVSNLADRVECEPELATVSGDGDLVRRLKPVRLTWSLLNLNLSFTCGAWIPLAEVAPARSAHARQMFINVLARLDRAAVLVERGGAVVLISGRAERMMENGIGVANGRLKCSHSANQRTLTGAIAAALDRYEKVTISLERTDGGMPVIVRAAPFALDLPGSNGAKLTTLALLIFTDPTAPAESDAKPALQLLGLTPSEARTAALVGRGLSPREAAIELGLAEGSIRTTLKRVFSKLGLSRQSELALLISRIADILG